MRNALYFFGAFIAVAATVYYFLTKRQKKEDTAAKMELVRAAKTRRQSPNRDLNINQLEENEQTANS